MQEHKCVPQTNGHEHVRVFKRMMDLSFNSIDVERRGHGRRYSCLPVDTIDRNGFTIDCTGSYLHPEMFDLQPGDIIRWIDKGRRMQGCILNVERNGVILQVSLQEVALLPEDFFAP